jgi:hypothetical protein
MSREKKEADPDDLSLSARLAPSNRTFLLVGSIITAALIVDVFITWLFDIVDVTLQGSSLGLAIFVATVVVINGAGQYYLLSAIRKVTAQVRRKIFLYNFLFWSVIAIEFILAGIFLSIILEISLSGRYHTAWVVAATALSMLGATAVMAFQSYTFFSWFRIRTKNVVIMVYALAPGLAAAGVGIGVFRSFLRLLEGPTLINQTDSISFQLTSSFGQYQPLFYLSVLLLLVSYMFFWIGSVLHLRSYSRKKGRFKYWLLAFIPAIVFPLTLVISIGAEASVPAGDPEQAGQAVLGYRLMAIISALVSFIMNGSVYFILSKNILATGYGQTKSIHYYLILAGFGTMTLGISIAVPTFSTYPPFESVPRSFMMFASYMYSIGIYSSANSLAEDARLRQSIKKLAFESGLLDGIGYAQMEKELQDRVATIVKKHSDGMEESGIGSSLTEEDAKKYLEQIMEELRKSKKDDQQGKADSNPHAT